MVLVPSEPLVLVVEDDLSVRNLVARLLEYSGYQVRTFVSAEEFLNTNVRPQVGCLVVDLHLPGLDGLALQERMLKEGNVSADCFYYRRRGYPDDGAGHEERGQWVFCPNR
jgi:FixJ family two-component response regulator